MRESQDKVFYYKVNYFQGDNPSEGVLIYCCCLDLKML